jgi:phage tail-like protein
MSRLLGLANALANFKMKRFAFLISIDGHAELTQAGFEGVQGLGLPLPPFVISEAGSVRKWQFPDKVEVKPLTLVHGIDFFGDLFQWIKDAETWEPGKPDYRKHLSIYLMERIVSRTAHGITADTAVAVRGWDIFNAWPTDWKLDDLDANESGVAFERIQLIYETIENASLETATISITI